MTATVFGVNLFLGEESTKSFKVRPYFGNTKKSKLSTFPWDNSFGRPTQG